jgi:predicted metalloprotease with PDZ domain
LVDHPIEMGTPQVASFVAHGAVHEIVFTGLMPNLDLERIGQDIQRICATQIAFFEPRSRRAPFLDSSDRYVFMTMVTGDGYGGLEHRASTALMTSRSDLPVRGVSAQSEGYRNFLGLVSHEYFHTWNVKRIKPAVFAPYDLDQENYTRLLWLFEGFTSYYDDLLLLRSQGISLADYLRTLAKTINSVQSAPGRFKQSVAESSFDAWTKYYRQDENAANAIVSYYTKGSLVALGLDLTLRTATDSERSLDDVMRLLWTRYGRDFYRGAGKGLPEDAIGDVIKEATGVDVDDFLLRYVYGREDVPLAALFGDHDMELQWKAVSPLPSMGVRTGRQGEDLRLTTVYEKGPAHKAGLSAHDVLVSLDGLRVTPTNLDKLLGRYRVGDSVVVHAFRRDELRAFKVRLVAAAQECTLVQTPAKAA